MFKLVVLSALVAVALAAPAPGHLAVAAPVAYTTHVGPSVSIPTAVSHQSRTDVHHKGVIATTYTAPAVVAAVHAAPVAAVHTAYAAPAVVAAPALHTAYASPLVASAYTTGVHGYVATHPVGVHSVVAGHPVAYAHHY